MSMLLCRYVTSVNQALECGLLWSFLCGTHYVLFGMNNLVAVPTTLRSALDYKLHSTNNNELVTNWSSLK